MPKPRTDARERILSVADELFCREGVRAIGVDTIIAQSEVAKTTFYRYFPSKDDLIATYLEERNQQFWQLFDQVANQYPDDPKQQLLAIFRWFDEVLASPESYGCAFLMVASEFPEFDHPGHQVAIAHKQQLRDRITKLIEQAGIQPAEELSAALLLLGDGAFAELRLFRKPNNGISLEKAATMMIAAYANA
ncbi:MAG: TetR/AcrR family transcriptional regulator [Nitrospira sp.]|nr:TetR/AcrR family transcriptional regulator [Nitrospira sp.]NJR51347.1 TetR/AcrR family transcriptional regulator [Leptolyngbyaceae cyanobacterium CSU_1_3]